MGAIVNGEQLEKILGYVDVGLREGAKLVCGGKRLTEGGLDRGHFMRPTILANVDNRMRVAREETFGPVATFIKFASCGQQPATLGQGRWAVSWKSSPVQRRRGRGVRARGRVERASWSCCQRAAGFEWCPGGRGEG